LKIKPLATPVLLKLRKRLKLKPDGELLPSFVRRRKLRYGKSSKLH
jgi:hypothetical protein